MELMLYTTMDGLSARLEAAYPDIEVIAPSRIDQARRLLQGERPPDALYVDDSRGTPIPDLWGLIEAAHGAHVRVLVNMYGMAQSLLAEARLIGAAEVSERDVAAVVAWLGQSLGVTARTSGGRVPILAVGAAKGGIGKTFMTCLLAEGLRRRGLRVLVWDSDISNPGLVPAFRIPSSSPSYLHLIQRGAAHWNPTGIAPFIFQAEHTQGGTEGWGVIDFLIGSHAVARAENDVRLPDWQGLYQGVSQLDGYDLVIIDTPPDYLRRPYATHTLLSGGTVVLPCPPGARERMGVGHMLDHFREAAPDRLDRCALLFVEPEKGVTVKVKDVLQIFGGRYPEVRALGTVPRAPRLASLSDEHDGYLSMYDLGPNTTFVQAAHRIVDSLAAHVGVMPRLPMPKIGAWAAFKGRMRGEKVDVPAANTSVGMLARDHAS
jgi:cellulose biosynthesis protein BcsQ